MAAPTFVCDLPPETRESILSFIDSAPSAKPSPGVLYGHPRPPGCEVTREERLAAAVCTLRLVSRRCNAIFTARLADYVRETKVDLTRAHLRRLVKVREDLPGIQDASLLNYVRTLTFTVVHYEEYKRENIWARQVPMINPSFPNPDNNGNWDRGSVTRHYLNATITDHIPWLAEKRKEENAFSGEEMISLIKAVLRGLPGLKRVRIEAEGVLGPWYASRPHDYGSRVNRAAEPCREEHKWRRFWARATLGYRVVMAALAHTAVPEDGADDGRAVAPLIESLSIFQDTHKVAIPTNEIASPLRFLANDARARKGLELRLSKLREFSIRIATTTLMDAEPLSPKLTPGEYFARPRYESCPSLGFQDPRVDELADFEGVTSLLRLMPNLVSLELGLFSTLRKTTTETPTIQETPAIVNGRFTAELRRPMLLRIYNIPIYPTLLTHLSSTVPLPRLTRLSLAGFHVTAPVLPSLLSTAYPALRHLSLKNIFLYAPPPAAVAADPPQTPWQSLLVQIALAGKALDTLQLDSLRLSYNAATPLAQEAEPAWPNQAKLTDPWSRWTRFAALVDPRALPQTKESGDRRWYKATLDRRELDSWASSMGQLGVEIMAPHDMWPDDRHITRLWLEHSARDLGPPGASLDTHEHSLRWRMNIGLEAV